ncbi:MAG TPA: type II secretion system protein GspG [Pyrinomonadaceae bacterium]|nr:type II secretion system protein GspG [Pyrinomonadaceae bacterium]
MSNRARLVVLALCLLAASASAIVYTSAADDLSAREARRLIARIAGSELPTDAVRVRSISSMGSSAVVEAQVETAFRFVRGDNGKWRVAEIRMGENRWEDVDIIARAVNQEKTERARAELETFATALESFRRERGFYVEAATAVALVDQLNPRYLERIIRVDPWHRPYQYEGSRNQYTLRSTGLDGKANTGDDVVLEKRAQ